VKPQVKVAVSHAPPKAAVVDTQTKKAGSSVEGPVQLELKKMQIALNQGCTHFRYSLLVMLTAKVVPQSSDILVGMGDGRVLLVESQTHKSKEVARCMAHRSTRQGRSI
jgi:hypothetical protein